MVRCSYTLHFVANFYSVIKPHYNFRRWKMKEEFCHIEAVVIAPCIIYCVTKRPKVAYKNHAFVGVCTMAL